MSSTIVSEVNTATPLIPSGVSLTSYWLPLLDYGTLLASVVDVNPTATTLWVNSDGNTYDLSGIYNASITFGPWAAQRTPAAGVSTGVYDLYEVHPPVTIPIDTAVSGSEVQYSATRTYSLHCDIVSGNVAGTCTAIYTSMFLPSFDHSTYTIHPGLRTPMAAVPIAITAGIEKFAGSTSASLAASTSASSISSKTIVSTASRTTSTGIAASTSASSAASHTHGINLGAIGLLGLVAAFLSR